MMYRAVGLKADDFSFSGARIEDMDTGYASKRSQIPLDDLQFRGGCEGSIDQLYCGHIKVMTKGYKSQLEYNTN